jgi:hypothetical protein
MEPEVHIIEKYFQEILPLEISKCKKCGEIIAEPKELIRIVKHPGQRRI